MPDVKPNESEDDFVQRCIPVVIEDGTAEDGGQAAAICHSMWREARKNMSDIFLKAIRARSRKAEPFGYGIVTADVYVRTLLERAGSDACYQYAASKQASFDDLLRKAATTVVYSNSEMVVKELRAPLSNGAELPKNTLMVFRHVLTTPREDRDGDILRSEGATLDPKMLLLWQHVHTLPIGKYLATNSHDDKGVIVTSAIVDINATAHDAAVMLDNGMGRFSHGFRAIEFEQRKSSGDVEAGSFDVKRFEVMEESLVSVPSNIDADTEEVLLSLVAGGKLTSPLLKRIGEGIRDKRSTRVPITVDVKLLVDGKEVRHGGEPGPRAAEGAGQVAAGGAPKETDDGSDEGAPKAAGDAQVKKFSHNSTVADDEPNWGSVDKAKLPRAAFSDQGEEGKKSTWKFPHHYIADGGDPDDNGVYTTGTMYLHRGGVAAAWAASQGGRSGEEASASVKSHLDAHRKAIGMGEHEGKSMESEKRGRVLSNANESKIRDARDNITEVVGMDVPRSAKALLREANRGLDDVLSGLGEPEGEAMTVPQAVGFVLATATKQERERLRAALEAIEQQERDRPLVDQYRAFVGAQP